MMIKTTLNNTLRLRHMLCIAAAASALSFAVPAVAQTGTAPVSSPTSPPKAAAAQGAKPAARSLANRLQAICSSADLNHDGSVSLDEFHEDIVQSWHNLSPDAAGYVQLADLAHVPRMGKGRLKRLAAIDKDGDGKLSFKEVVEARMAFFESADTDQNDQLSVAECVAYERHRRSGKS